MSVRILKLVFVSIFFTTTSLAEVPSEASIKELFEITRVKSLSESTMKSMEDYLKNMSTAELSNKKLDSAAMSAAIEKNNAKISKTTAIMKEKLSWEVLEPEYIKLYQETFTPEEVNGLVQFYKTPAGIATLTKLPVLMQRALEISQTKLIPIMQEFQTDLKGQ